jgi:uncharacterized Zn finger protein
MMDSTRRTDGHGWTRQWRAWLHTLGLAEGERSSARVKRLEVLPGRITATVQDRGVAYEVEIRFATWTDEQWQRVLDALGSQALFAAQLLAGDLPPELERTIAAAGVRLLPTGLDELEHHCTCHKAGARACEHLAAAYLALGDMLAEDPWLLFRLRGRDQQSILRGLRTQRARSGEATRSAPAAKPAERRPPESGFYRTSAVTTSEEALQPLEQQMDAYWGSAKALEDFRPSLTPPAVELALLRRLGPPPMGAVGGETYERLAALYRRISQATMTLAYAADPAANGDNGEPA